MPHGKFNSSSHCNSPMGQRAILRANGLNVAAGGCRSGMCYSSRQTLKHMHTAAGVGARAHRLWNTDCVCARAPSNSETAAGARRRERLPSRADELPYMQITRRLKPRLKCSFEMIAYSLLLHEMIPIKPCSSVPLHNTCSPFQII